MRVKCQKCGKSFEYDKYCGICPKCGRYMSQTNKDVVVQDYGKTYENSHEKSYENSHQRPYQRLHEKPYESTYESTHQNSHDDTDKKTADATQTAKETHTAKNRKQIIFNIIMIVLIFVIPQFSNVIEKYEKDKLYKEQKVVTLNEATQKVGTTFDFMDSQLAIQDAELFTYAGITPPEGVKYIAISYTLKSTYSSYDSNSQSEIYLKVGNEFAETVSPYDMTENEIIRNNLYKEIDTDLGYSSDGKVVFAVPKNENAFELKIYEKTRKDDKSNYTIDKVTSVPIVLKEAE